MPLVTLPMQAVFSVFMKDCPEWTSNSCFKSRLSIRTSSMNSSSRTSPGTFGMGHSHLGKFARLLAMLHIRGGACSHPRDGKGKQKTKTLYLFQALHSSSCLTLKTKYFQQESPPKNGETKFCGLFLFCFLSHWQYLGFLLAMLTRITPGSASGTIWDVPLLAMKRQTSNLLYISGP